MASFRMSPKPEKGSDDDVLFPYGIPISLAHWDEADREEMIQKIHDFGFTYMTWSLGVNEDDEEDADTDTPVEEDHAHAMLIFGFQVPKLTSLLHINAKWVRASENWYKILDELEHPHTFPVIQFPVFRDDKYNPKEDWGEEHPDDEDDDGSGGSDDEAMGALLSANL